MRITIGLIIWFYLFAFSFNKAQNNYPIEIDFKYLNEKVILCSGTQFMTNQVAIKSNEGIILIDTGISPEYAAALRDSLIKKFQLEKFSYIINTHHHWDHSQGNQFFNTAPIIAHAKYDFAINKQSVTAPEADTRYTKAKAEQLRNSIPPPPPSHIFKNGERGFQLTPPTIAFKEYLIVKSGDMTLHLIYYGSAHTDNDILIYIPELGLLAVGDLFFRNSLPQFSKHNKLDVERWMSVLRFLLEEEKSIQYVIPGHYAIFSKNELEQYFHYIKTMWKGINFEVVANKSLDNIKKEFSLVNSFPELIGKDMKSQSGSSLHEGNIEILWNKLKMKK